ncbi:hypothetical protein [Catenulispora pinistramenti]|uniref:hypothetical protein n=1 Tax=Catenulispora pinistramenti TaxID=2705254 RepID=UPI003F685382
MTARTLWTAGLVRPADLLADDTIRIRDRWRSLVAVHTEADHVEESGVRFTAGDLAGFDIGAPKPTAATFFGTETEEWVLVLYVDEERTVATGSLYCRLHPLRRADLVEVQIPLPPRAPEAVHAHQPEHRVDDAVPPARHRRRLVLRHRPDRPHLPRRLSSVGPR